MFLGAGCRGQGTGFKVQDAGCRLQGSGFQISCAGFRVKNEAGIASARARLAAVFTSLLADSEVRSLPWVEGNRTSQFHEFTEELT